MASDRTFVYESDQQNLAGDAIIELFTINLTTAVDASFLMAGQVLDRLDDDQRAAMAIREDTPSALYFCNWQETDGNFVKFGGEIYAPLPYQSSGFAISNEGVLPNPQLTVSNVGLVPTALINIYSDLLGTEIIRTRVLAKHLDNGSDPDVNSKWPDETWFVQRKVTENKLFVTWELSTPFDLDGVTIPKRRALRNSCSNSDYRSADLGLGGFPGLQMG